MQPINAPTYLRLREQIREDIIAGVWALGSHVTLAELSTHYQVSNNPVREALLQLQGEGVVTMRVHRGAVIPAVDADYIDNVYRLRGAIQAMLARDACERASPAELKQLQAYLQAHEDAVASNEVAACVNANRTLHRYLDSLGRNPLALEVMESRSSLVDAFRRAHGYGAGRLDAVVAQHRKVVRAVVKRDADKAVQAVMEHTESSRQDLMTLLRRPASH
jgi:DNA-binding GntR family transcriptional regulator